MIPEMDWDFCVIFERFVIGALMVDQLNEWESERLLNMEGVPDMLEPFKALTAILRRNALMKRLQSGADLIENATDEKELIKYKRLYDAIEKKYSEVDEQCKHYGL